MAQEKIAFKPGGLPLLIGSLPLASHEQASELVFSYTPEIPLWVQLPVHRQEGMIIQFLPGLPGYQSGGDELLQTKGQDFEAEVLAFYEEYLQLAEPGLSLSGSRFSLDETAAPGFFTFLKRLGRHRQGLVAVKGQITGPVTFATGVKDQDRRSIFYDEQLRDMAVKMLALKARWQVEQLAQFNVPVLIFFDEPALTGFGSSEFISITRDDVLAAFGEIFSQVHGLHGLTGVHVCANADWSLILDSEADILSFDAYAYFDKLLLYPDELSSFLEQGGIIAWGIVPTLQPEDIARESVESLWEKWQGQMDRLLEVVDLDPDDIVQQVLITPSCGTGSLEPGLARKVLELTKSLSKRVRESYGLV